MTSRTKSWARLVAVLLAVTLVAAACGGGDDDGGDDVGGGDTTVPEEEELGEPVRGGTLRYGMEAETDGLNPTRNRFSVVGLQMGLAVFDTITAFDTDGVAQPYLAESLTPNADFTSWDIKVREGISFHDGTPLNADALVRNVEGQLSDPLISLAVRPVLAEDNPVEKVDEYTARLNTRGPTANLPNFLTGQLGMVSSPTWLDAAEEDTNLNQNPVGTGPFRFDSRTQDSRTRFVRNDDWWRTQQEGIEVYLDAVEFYIQTDPARRVDQLVNGDLELLHTTDAEAIESLRRASGVVSIEEELGEESYAMINTEKAPFDDIRARQALTFATPREDYIDLIGRGILTGADTLFHPDLRWHNPDIVQEADDPDRAVELAAEYCAENPGNCSGGKINMEFKYTGPSVANQEIADLLIDGWSVAFNITPTQVLQDDYITLVAFGDYQVVTWRQFGAVDPDADQVWLDCNSIGGLSLNWPRICNEERQDLLTRQRASADQDERVELWQEIARTINEDYIYIFFTHTLWANGARENVKNIRGAAFPNGEPIIDTENGRHFLYQIWLEN